MPIITMPRPHKCRKVRFLPRHTHFAPAPPFAAGAETVTLSLDEAEAVRLADLLEQEQEPAAAGMGVSRQTFGLILRSARAKLADCIINGKPLHIAGGQIALHTAGTCRRCGGAAGGPSRTVCPRCACRKNPGRANCRARKENLS